MRTITGLFDSRPEAERAVEALVQQHDIPRDRVQVVAAGTGNATAGTTRARSEDHHGFVAEPGCAGAEAGPRRGGIMVAVQVEDAQGDGATEVFRQHGATDLAAREAGLQQGDWTGGSMAGVAPER